MIKLVRLDHRLLHGQVVFAWVQAMGIKRIVIVDDAAATDDLKKTALNLTKPSGVRLNIFTLETALGKMPKVEELQENIMFIFGSVRTMREFCEAYPKITEINYGGVARKEGSKKYSDAIFLTEEEAEDSKKLKEMNITMYMQQTPSFKKELLNSML